MANTTPQSGASNVSAGSRAEALATTARSAPSIDNSNTQLHVPMARSSGESVSEFALLMRRIDQISDKLSEQIATTTSVLRKKVEVLNQRSLTLESSLKEIRSIVDRQQTVGQQPQQPPTGPPIMTEEPIGNDEEKIYVPPDLNDGLLSAHSMSMEKLRLLVASAPSRGNFACRIVENLFPELFDPDNLRYSYS